MQSVEAFVVHVGGGREGKDHEAIHVHIGLYREKETHSDDIAEDVYCVDAHVLYGGDAEGDEARGQRVR